MNTVSIIGGDKRHVYLAEYFINAGWSVITYGLPAYLLPAQCQIASSLSQAMDGQTYIVSSIPLSRDGKNLTALEPFHIGLKDFLSYLKKGHIFFAGDIHYLAVDHCEKYGISYYDFMSDNQIAILNSVATAEGAIMKAIEKSTITLHQSSCLILGYGRCGKSLSDKLKGLNAKITITDKSPEALAFAKAAGFRVQSLASLSKELYQYSFLFNTIPYPILTRELLKEVSPQVTIIDIASHPGGVDYNAAKEYGINATLYLGIPGKTAPKTSAEILGDKITNLIKAQSLQLHLPELAASTLSEEEAHWNNHDSLSCI